MQGTQSSTLAPVVKGDMQESNLEAEFFFASIDKRKDSYKHVEALDVASLPAGVVSFVWVELVDDAFGEAVCVPVIVAKGAKEGPVLGLVAALHGNEIQGIPVIHSVMHDLRPRLAEMCGTVVGVACANPLGFARSQRGYVDMADLNRIFPGKKNGCESQQFVHALMARVLSQLDYCLDLHTASEGRQNSLYLRADMTNSECRRMALALSAQILLHNAGPDGSLRGHLTNRENIPTVVLEMGNPSIFNMGFIEVAIHGMFALLAELKIIDLVKQLPDRSPSTMAIPTLVFCTKSFWLQSMHGGLLHVHVKVNTRVSKGDEIASIVDIFGFVVAEYRSPFDGIVIGRSSRPNAVQGDRIIHLGVIAKDGKDTQFDTEIKREK